MNEQAHGQAAEDARQQRAALARALTILRVGLELLEDAERTPLVHDVDRVTLTQALLSAVNRAMIAASLNHPGDDAAPPIR
jgi:hypothetical protein